MTNWLLRGLVLAGVMFLVRLAQSVGINTWPTQAGLITIVVLLLGAPWAILWGAIDGRADAHAQPDPDRRADLPMTWLLAGLVAGILGGALSWLTSLLYKGFYVGGLISELTTFAAFTALIVFVPGVAGVAIGRWLVDRGYAKLPQRHHGLAAHEEGGADTDVFAAVSAGAEPTAPVAGGAAAAEVPGSEAPTAGWTTEEFPVETEETTAAIPEPGKHENPDERSS